MEANSVGDYSARRLTIDVGKLWHLCFQIWAFLHANQGMCITCSYAMCASVVHVAMCVCVYVQVCICTWYCSNSNTRGYCDTKHTCIYNNINWGEVTKANMSLIESVHRSTRTDESYHKLYNISLGLSVRGYYTLPRAFTY